MKFEGFSGLPILNDLTSFKIRFLTLSHKFEGIYALEAAEHFCPWYSKAPLDMPVATWDGFADSCAIIKSFPPVSPTILG